MKKLVILFLAVLCGGTMIAGDVSVFQKTSDIDYVDDGKVGHRLDIYFPQDDGKAKHPVIIHIYGSAWQSNNSKGADEETIGFAALEAGYIFVTPNHRSSKDAKFPAQLNDLKAVVRYLRANAETLGIDTSFIAMSGFSSGGHLASLMGVTRNVKEYTVGSTTMDLEGNIGKYTKQSSWIHAVCDWSGPTDERHYDCGEHYPWNPEIELVGCSYEDCPDRYDLMAVTTYIDASDPPFMLAYGSKDQVVPQCMGHIFYENLRSAGVDAEWYLHDGNHEVMRDYLDEMITFFNRVKKSQPTAVNNTAVKSSAKKFFRDGVLLIKFNGRTFNAQGTQVK